MINQIKLDNFGPLSSINWSELGKINLVIGGNGSGKTFLLKSIYSSLRTLEYYKRGNEQRSASEILADKLYWTFQAEKIGDLVGKGTDVPLSSCITLDNKEFSYSFGKDTTKQITLLESHVPPRSSNSIFLPAILERSTACCSNVECGGLPAGNGGVGWIGRDTRRRG